MSMAITKCAVIGAGTMGSGIAFVAAAAGIDVFQVDVKQEQLDRARAYQEAGADFLFIEAPLTKEELLAIPAAVPGIHLCNIQLAVCPYRTMAGH